MRIATFNANSIRARLDTVLSWLDEHRPDVLCLQETKVKDAQFPALAFAAKGWNVVFRGGKAHAGVALVSRVRPSRVSFGLDDGGEPDETRLLCAKVGPITIVNTYVPQGREIDHPMYRYKVEWLGRLRAHFERHFSARARVVWAGDMNVAPEAIDIHNAERQANHVCYHAAAREAFAAARDWGFVDVFRRHHPEPGQYTFFDYRQTGALKKNQGWRVDHILATRPLTRRSTACWIDLAPRRGPRPSDHTFVVADFDLG